MRVKENCGEGHSGAPARGLADRRRGFMLPRQAAAPQHGDRYRPMDGVLRHDGGYPSCGLPGEKAPHFLLYLRTITKASRTFESSAWASYDMAYRCQAANRGSLDWGIVGIVDPALYNEAFAGRAKLVPCCRYCLVDTHPSPECLFAGGLGQTDGRPVQALSPPAAAGSSQPTSFSRRHMPPV